MNSQEAQDRIRALAEDEYRKGNKDKKKMIDSMERLVLGDSNLVTAIVRDAVAAAVLESFRFALKTARERIVGSLRKSSEIEARFLDWPLASGTLLGDSTKDEILANCDRYRKQASTMLVYADFLAQVASRLTDGQRVSEVLTEDQLVAMMTEAEGRRM